MSGLTIGASYYDTTYSRIDDYCQSTSSWANPKYTHRDWELPEVCAPESYTSYATPIVAATSAVIENANPNLEYWPEGKRAIIIATADHNCEAIASPGYPPSNPVFMSSLNEPHSDYRCGAGQVNIFNAGYVAGLPTPAAADLTSNSESSPAAYGYYVTPLNWQSGGNIGPGSFWSQEFYYSNASTSNQRVRAVIAWNSTATCSDPNDIGCSADAIDADLDLWARDTSTGALLETSASWDNPYEVIDIPVPASGKVTFQIYLDGGSDGPSNPSGTFLGFAMWDYTPGADDE